MIFSKRGMLSVEWRDLSKDVTNRLNTVLGQWFISLSNSCIVI
jgi:hypothetical protein